MAGAIYITDCNEKRLDFEVISGMISCLTNLLTQYLQYDIIDWQTFGWYAGFDFEALLVDTHNFGML